MKIKLSNMDVSNENSSTTETLPSGSSVDCGSGALQSNEFRYGLTEIVAKTLAQIKDATPASRSQATHVQAVVEAVGSITSRTGDALLNPPPPRTNL